MDLSWKRCLRWSKRCPLIWPSPLQFRTSILPPKAYLWTMLPCLPQTTTEVPLSHPPLAWQCHLMAACKVTKHMATFLAGPSSLSTQTPTPARLSPWWAIPIWIVTRQALLQASHTSSWNFWSVSQMSLKFKPRSWPTCSKSRPTEASTKNWVHLGSCAKWQIKPSSPLLNGPGVVSSSENLRYATSYHNSQCPLRGNLTMFLVMCSWCWKYIFLFLFVWFTITCKSYKFYDHYFRIIVVWLNIGIFFFLCSF